MNPTRIRALTRIPAVNRSLTAEELLDERVSRNCVVLRYLRKDGRKRSDAQRVVTRNGDVMLFRLLAGEPDVATGRVTRYPSAESALTSCAPDTSRGSFMRR